MDAGASRLHSHAGAWERESLLTFFSFPSFTWERHAGEALLHQRQAKLGIQCVPKQVWEREKSSHRLTFNDAFFTHHS